MRTLLLLFLAVISASCVTSGDSSGGASGSGGTSDGGAGTALPDANFLSTDYEPLETWMDERFEVEYRDMTARLMFRQAPISDIRYELRNLPGDGKRFDLKSEDVSRREILEAVARFYDLEMTVELVNGTPAYVRVVGRPQSAPPAGGVYGSGPYGGGGAVDGPESGSQPPDTREL